MKQRLTAIIQAEGARFVSLCPELDIASQGDSIEEARANLHEALELFFECASPVEIAQRFDAEGVVSPVLAKLLDEVTDENRHAETETGPSIGCESW